MTGPDARKLPPAGQEDLRRRVVAAVRDGMGKSEAARTFKVSRQSIDNWMNAVAAGGTRALRARKRGPKKGAGLLAPHQAATIVRLITARCPDQLHISPIGTGSNRRIRATKRVLTDNSLVNSGQIESCRAS